MISTKQIRIMQIKMSLFLYLLENDYLNTKFEKCKKKKKSFNEKAKHPLPHDLFIIGPSFFGQQAKVLTGSFCNYFNILTSLYNLQNK